MKTDLAVLVDVEARLDRELADARAAAAALEDAARTHVGEAAAALAAEIAADQARIAAAIERDTAAQLRAIDEAARRQVEMFEAIRGDREAAIAREVADELVALVNAEVTP
jgi:peptidoglycan hydrolase CwlO-like protein